MERTRYSRIAGMLAESGLVARGGFHPSADDLALGGDALLLDDGRPARAVIMVGNAGPAMWRVFQKQRPSGQDPLDRWSRESLERITARHDAKVVMPSDGPPFAPFQQWAMRAEPVFPSPIGLLIHPQWGLWHGYRGALLFAAPMSLPDRPASRNPCDSCVDRPCLSACPVGAFQGDRYLVDDCATYLQGPSGGPCMANGCLARHACPIGQNAFPGTDQAAFHMRAFTAARPGGAAG